MGEKPVFKRLVIAAVFLVVGCTHVTPHSGMPTPTQTFYHVIPIAVNAEKTDVIINPMQSVSNFNFALDDMTQAYFSRKLNAIGGHDVLAVTLEKCLVTHSEDKTGILGIGGNDVYHITMRIRLAYKNDVGYTVTGKVLTINRTITVTKHASIAMRERAQLEGVEAMFRTLDTWVDNTLAEL